MANTRKVLEEAFDPNDPTKQRQATTQADVNNQDAKTRLWQSLNYTYGQQREDLNKQYSKAVSQQDSALLGRGMQRSSYGMQTLADLRNEGIKAYNNNYSAQIADYQNRLTELEDKERENEWKEREFAENQRQFNENLGFQQSEAARNQQNTEWSQRFQESEAAREQKNTEWTQMFQQSEADRQQGNADREYNFSREQWQTQVEQWDKQFDYSKMSDDQKLAYNYIVFMAANGADPTDDLLARAGISRADYNGMKAQAKNSGGRGGKSTKTPSIYDQIAEGLGNEDAQTAFRNAMYQHMGVNPDADFEAGLGGGGSTTQGGTTLPVSISNWNSHYIRNNGRY